MSKTKRLLSVTLAIAMIILSAFSAFAEDTETVVEPLSGTVAAGNVTVKPDVTEVTVPVTITFENKQTSPHGMFDISADGATLKSATLVSFNNDNYVEDPNLSDEENIDKSVYLDADGINSANGRIVVESSTDESKKPATSEVKIDVVLEFATALKADQVIDVVIDGIQATNFSEASWDGMKAVNGTITVEVDEPEDTLTVTTDAKPAGNTTFMARQRYTYTFTGEVASYGVLVWREAAYDAAYSETDGLDLTTYTANIPITAVDANGYTTNGLAVTGIALPKITEVFYTVPYVVDTNGVTYYSDETFSFSYAAYLIDRMTTGSTEVQAKVNAIMDLYYSTEGVQVYDGQTAPEYTFESKGTYTAVPEMTVEDNGDFVTSVSRAGATKTAALRIDIDYSNAPAYVSKGCLVYTPDDYVAGNATADFVLNGTRAEVAGISFFAFKTQYVFVPYVVDTDGNRYYGSTVKASYADWLVDKLNQGTTAAPKVQAMADLYELLEIGEAFFTVG